MYHRNYFEETSYVGDHQNWIRNNIKLMDIGIYFLYGYSGISYS